MEALTPNTAAFLDSLTNFDASNPTSLPPSAFFQVPAPIPGRDTPEDSPLSSVDAETKPRDESEDDSSPDPETKAAHGTMHKRKAGHAQTQAQEADDDEEDEDDSNDEAPSGHEDKRQHSDKPRRKSSGKDEFKGKDNLTKAQRRKEQNRAAQKAFRERREAKVRDLEDKVSELEAKSFGVTVENENLRGILRRLQEENVALKQAAFTFSMPTSKSPNQSQDQPAAKPPTPAQPPFVAQPQQVSPPGIDWSMFSQFKQPTPQVGKPPSPPQSVSDSNGPHPSHRGSSSSNMVTDNSPESLVSLNSVGDTNQRSLFDPVNAPFAAGSLQPTLQQTSNNTTPSTNGFAPSFNVNRSESGVSPNSVANSNSSADMEAFFRNFLNGPNGPVPQFGQQQQLQQQPQPRQQEDPLAMFTAPANSSQIGPYTFLASPGLVSTADSSSNMSKLLGDSTSYRDMQAPPAAAPAPVAPAAAPSPNWADLADSSVSDFLASLTGSTGDNNSGIDAADDAFEQQLRAILAGTSTDSNAFFPQSGNVFSPTNYLNMSPSPLNSISPPNSVPSASNSASASNSNHTSPDSNPQRVSGNLAPGDQLGTGVSTFGPPKHTSEIVHVVGPNGEVMRPAEVWMKMGMQHADDPGDLMIDDLCDMMKSKATCKDGRKFVTYDDVENMVRHRGKEDVSASMARNRNMGVPEHLARTNAAYDVLNTNLANKGACSSTKDPQQCQATMNNIFIQSNGGVSQ